MLRTVLQECRLCSRQALAVTSSSSPRAITPKDLHRLSQARLASTTTSPSTSSPVPSTSSSAQTSKSKKPGGLNKKQLRQDRSSRIRQRPSAPDGQAIAFSTAESYDIDALRKALWNKGLLGRGDGDDAVNLMGEAIWVPRWPLQPSVGEEVESTTSPTEAGELFIFESGAFVSWNMSEASARDFANNVLRNIDSKPRLASSVLAQEVYTPVEVDKYREEQTEAMDFVILNNQSTGVKGDCIIIGESGDSQESDTDFASPPLATAIHPPSSASSISRNRNQSTDSLSASASGTSMRSTAARGDLRRSENDLRARLTLSRGLARSTKLAVYEEMLDSHMDEVEHIPAILAQGSEGPLKKKDIVRITGNLLKIRQYLYLNDENLIDMPEMFWSSPELEVWFQQMTKALDVELRMRNLRTKLDYSLELQETLLDLNSTKVSHRLEWIIIILIAIEIGLALIREGVPGFRSDKNQVPHTRLLEDKKEV